MNRQVSISVSMVKSATHLKVETFRQAFEFPAIAKFGQPIIEDNPCAPRHGGFLLQA